MKKTVSKARNNLQVTVSVNSSFTVYDLFSLPFRAIPCFSFYASPMLNLCSAYLAVFGAFKLVKLGNKFLQRMHLQKLRIFDNSMIKTRKQIFYLINIWVICIDLTPFSLLMYLHQTLSFTKNVASSIDRSNLQKLQQRSLELSTTVRKIYEASTGKSRTQYSHIIWHNLVGHSHAS